MNSEKSQIILINIIIPLLAAFLGVGSGYVIYSQPEFIISVEPITSPIPGPSEENVIITIEDEHFFNKYENQIILLYEFIGLEGGEPDIEISFDPSVFDPRNTNGDSITSNMTIRVGSSVIPDEYKIKIIGSGGDGMEKSCVFILNVPPY